jgi:hypothetical protein
VGFGQQVAAAGVENRAMDYLDRRIQELMSERDAHLLRASQPHGWLGITRAMRTGKLAWLFWVTWILQLVFLVIGLWAAVRFYQAAEVLAAVKWGFTGAVFLLGGLQIKLSMAPHIHAERILRELKRVEILILAQEERLRERAPAAEAGSGTDG